MLFQVAFQKYRQIAINQVKNIYKKHKIPKTIMVFFSSIKFIFLKDEKNDMM